MGSTHTGEPYVDKKYLRAFLAQLEYPLYFLDFETISPGVPLFDDARPFGHIPFQFSLHIQEMPGAAPRHESFLAGGRADPRKEFLDRLKALLGNKGSIVVYNESFELSRLDELTVLFPSSRSWYNQVKRRVRDLLRPFRDFAYYHPDQHGSASIKAVLPVLTHMSYEGLEIGDGGTASGEYLRVTFGDAEGEDRSKVRTALEVYCAQDTLAMVNIVEKLGKLTR